MSYAYGSLGLGLSPDVDPTKWYVDEQIFWVDEHEGTVYKGHVAKPEPTLPDAPTIADWCRATKGPHFARGPYEYGDMVDNPDKVIREIDLHDGDLPEAIRKAKTGPINLPAFEPLACPRKTSVTTMSLYAAGGLAVIAGALYLTRRKR